MHPVAKFCRKVIFDNSEDKEILPLNFLGFITSQKNKFYLVNCIDIVFLKSFYLLIRAIKIMKFKIKRVSLEKTRCTMDGFAFHNDNSELKFGFHRNTILTRKDTKYVQTMSQQTRIQILQN